MFRLRFRNKGRKLINLSPAKMIILSFLTIILIGTFLLSLPVASNSGKSAGFFMSLFTSTSATCITGFVVADTSTQWSLFGQIVILLLVQCGGIGILTFTTFFSILIGRKVGLKGMLLMQESLNHFSFEGILRLVRRVVFATLTIETVGALLLATSFVPKFGVKGLYMSVFHSITAFCNAGFDIMGEYMGPYNNFMGFNNDPIVIYTLAALIVIGGLGFIVWKDLYEYRQTRTLLLHTKVVLVMSSILIVVGSIAFFAFEHTNPATMGELSFFEKVNASVFHSITCRSSGFNTLPPNDMTEISKFTTVLLMFIGAAPGSTGGGIKVTTLSIIIVAILSQIRGSQDVIIFKKRVPSNAVNKSIAIIGLAGLWVIFFTAVILVVEKSRAFIDVLYDMTSALATVGLSSTFTPSLGILSKIILLVTMFLGRVGPISFAIALTIRANKSKPDMVYPEGKIVVG